MKKGQTVDPDQQLEDDFPIAVATMPATPRQRHAALGVIGGLLVVAALIAPFANIQIGRIDAFIPVLQTVLAVADLLTATLLFVQYSTQPQSALLLLGSGYLFSGSFAFLQTLSFPGAYGPSGVIGDGYNSPAWFFVLWHTTFPLAILLYATSKRERQSTTTVGRMIGLTVLCSFALIAALTCVVTIWVAHLPSFYSGSVTLQTRLGNQINVAMLLWYATVFVVMLVRKRTILDQWLAVILLAWMPNFLVAAVASSVRFSVGWYAARGFALVASCLLLSVLLAEMTFLYSRLSNAFSLLRRERFNRLMSVDAATAAIAHEVRTPLAAIALNASAALVQVQSGSSELSEIEAILRDIEADAHRADRIISAVRALFKQTTERRIAVSLNALVREALHLARPDLDANHVSVQIEFAEDHQVHVRVDATQLQQAVLNLLRNAMDAMREDSGGRRIKLTTRVIGKSTVALSVQDAGTGVPEEIKKHLFEPFITTKVSGMGLGLAISRTLVENQGGRLALVSSGPEGSTFEISLPVLAEHHD